MASNIKAIQALNYSTYDLIVKVHDMLEMQVSNIVRDICMMSGVKRIPAHLLDFNFQPKKFEELNNHYVVWLAHDCFSVDGSSNFFFQLTYRTLSVEELSELLDDLLSSYHRIIAAIYQERADGELDTETYG